MTLVLFFSSTTHILTPLKGSMFLGTRYLEVVLYMKGLWDYYGIKCLATRMLL